MLLIRPPFSRARHAAGHPSEWSSPVLTPPRPLVTKGCRRRPHAGDPRQFVLGTGSAYLDEIAATGCAP